MLRKATLSHMIFMFKQKTTIFVIYTLLFMVLYNFVSNVSAFQGRDISRMYQPMKLLLLSYNRTNYNADLTLLFIQLYPLLVVLPAGFSLAGEQQSGQEVMMITRLGHFTYKLSKLFAAFLTTAMIFLVPFLLEMILNCLSFPLEAIGDLTNWSTYSTGYIESVSNYLFKDIYLISPYLYAILGTFLFSIVSGVLGAFTVAFSSIVRVKYRVILFLPVYILLYATIYLSDFLPGNSISTDWYSYLLFFNDENKNFFIFVISVFMLILFSFLSVFMSSRKECLR